MNLKSSGAEVRPLTVMQVLPRLEVGGVERGTVDWAIQMQKMGHRSLVVSGGGALVSQLETHGVLHLTLNVGQKSLKTLKSIKKLRQLITAHSVDLVHARSRLPAWLCWWAMQVKARPAGSRPGFVTTLHGLHSVNRYSSIMARGDRVIAVSNAAKAYLNTHFSKWLKQDPVVIHRGIDPGFDPTQADSKWLVTRFPELRSKQTVLLPGRLTHVKGADQMLTWLRQANFNQRLLLTAQPDDSANTRRFMELIQTHQVTDKVIWLGVQHEMRELYAGVDLVVSVNNKPESFGRTVLEALTMRVPVVAYAHGGVTEIMTELFPSGLVKAGDQSELTQRINAFLVAPPSVDPSQAFQLSNQFEQTWAVYQSVLSK